MQWIELTILFADVASCGSDVEDLLSIWSSLCFYSFSIDWRCLVQWFGSEFVWQSQILLSKICFGNVLHKQIHGFATSSPWNDHHFCNNIESSSRMIVHLARWLGSSCSNQHWTLEVEKLELVWAPMFSRAVTDSLELVSLEPPGHLDNPGILPHQPRNLRQWFWKRNQNTVDIQSQTYRN